MKHYVFPKYKQQNILQTIYLWGKKQDIRSSSSEKVILTWKIYEHGTSLVAQWLRIRLPMQGTRVQSLVWEDTTCRRVTKPVRHNY